MCHIELVAFTIHDIVTSCTNKQGSGNGFTHSFPLQYIEHVFVPGILSTTK